ncbi:hypothetical protein [Streptomyces sp. NBC_01207]|uniref:hypothetical protein n=1 Tax=Streptomyces sp. NBC_01207 TaxID=2903772 RepID=UPI002E1621B3|nr:hypothetical protein OG457_01205 [Streptomyces sp. NBC_01207]
MSPLELDRSVTGLEDRWGRHARLPREQLADTASRQERLELTGGFLRRKARRSRSCATAASCCHLAA